MPTERRDVTVPAGDGHALAATLFIPADTRPNTPVTIIGSATGVPRRFYARFAEFLARSGRLALTFDYRGIGGSRAIPVASDPSRFRDWGILDIPGILGWARTSYPDRPIHWVGHSYGGFGTGLAHNNTLIARHLGIATMTADYRLIESPFERLKVLAMFHGAAPLAVRLLGYAPGRLNGGSEDLPKGVVLEWAKWCLTREFLFGVDDLPERRYFATQTSPMLFLHATDDPWVARAGIEHLVRQFSAASNHTIERLTPQETGVTRIGHVGYFRADLAEIAWPKALAWLDRTD